MEVIAKLVDDILNYIAVEEGSPVLLTEIRDRFSDQDIRVIGTNLNILHKYGLIYPAPDKDIWAPTFKGMAIAKGENPFPIGGGSVYPEKVSKEEFAGLFPVFYEHVRTIHPEFAKVYSKMEESSDNSNYNVLMGIAWKLYNWKHNPKGLEIKKGEFLDEKYSKEAPKIMSSIEQAVIQEFILMRRELSSNFMQIPDMKQSIIADRMFKRFIVQQGEGLQAKVFNTSNIGTIFSQASFGKILEKFLATIKFKTDFDMEAFSESAYNHFVTLSNSGERMTFFEHSRFPDVVKSFKTYFKTENNPVLAINNCQASEVSKDIVKGVLNEALSGGNFAGYVFDSVNLSNLTIIGSNFTGATFNRKSIWTGATIQNCNFTNALVMDSQFNPNNFSGNTIDGADFKGSVGYNDESVEFSSNHGNPKNFVILKAADDEESFKEITRDISPVTNLYIPIDEKEKGIGLVLAENLYKILKSVKTTSLDLKFSQLPADESVLKKDIENLLSGGEKAEWMQNVEQARAVLIELQKSGKLKKMGFPPEMIGKIIGLLMPKRKKEEEIQKEQEEDVDRVDEAVLSKFTSDMEDFVRKYQGMDTVSKSDLLSIIPSQAIQIIDAINSFPGENINHSRLMTFYNALLQTLVDRSTASSFLREQKSQMSLFPHTTRISDVYRDRNSPQHGKYPNTFGIILEPTTSPFMSETVRVTTEAARYAAEVSPHFRVTLASARARPHTINEIGERGSIQRNIWFIVELQSDPLQSTEGLYLPLGGRKETGIWELNKETGDQELVSFKPDSDEYHIASAIIGSKKDSLSIEDIVNHLNGVDRLRNLNKSDLITENTSKFSKFFSTKPYSEGDEIRETIMDEKGVPHLIHGRVRSVKEAGAGIELGLTSEEKELLRRYGIADTKVVPNIAGVGLNPRQKNNVWAATALGDFRQYYKHWPEMLILETINRALEFGNVDQVWLPSYDTKWEATKEGRDPTDRRPTYDGAANHLGGKYGPAPIKLRKDDGSDMWSLMGEKDYPKNYYVFDLLPYKLDIRPGVDYPLKEGEGSSKVLWYGLLKNLKKYISVNKKKLPSINIPKGLDSQDIVVAYQESRSKGGIVSNYKEFIEKYNVNQKFSSTPTSLKFVGLTSIASLYGDRVMKYVRNISNKYKDLTSYMPLEMVIASGVVYVGDKYNLTPEDTREIIGDLHINYNTNISSVPLHNYVRFLLNAMNHVKKNLETVVRNSGEPAKKVAMDLYKSYEFRRGSSLDEDSLYYLSYIAQVIIESEILPALEKGGLGFGEKEEAVPAGDAPQDLKFEQQDPPLPQEENVTNQDRIDNLLDRLFEAQKNKDEKEVERIKGHLKKITAKEGKRKIGERADLKFSQA